MTIENVCVRDAGQLLAIYDCYVQNTAVSFEYDTPSAAEFRQRIETITQRYPYLKAVDDGRIVGYCYAACFKPRRAYDRAVETTIYLDQNARGRGIGRALYEKLEQELRERGFCNMNACIAVPNPNDPYLTDASIRFHEKMGFSRVGTFSRIGWKFGRWYDMTWMEKLIAPHEDEKTEL